MEPLSPNPDSPFFFFFFSSKKLRAHEEISRLGEEGIPAKDKLSRTFSVKRSEVRCLVSTHFHTTSISAT